MLNDVNLNDNFEKYFEYAYYLCNKEFDYEQLIEFLKEGSILEKQIAAIKLTSIYDIEDAKILLSNLTGCDGKIREVVAQKINFLLRNSNDLRQIFSEIAILPFANATIDINANICRMVIDNSSMLKNFDNFAYNYSSKIIDFAENALIEYDKFIFKDKKYLINKQLFKLYWCLEALCTFYKYSDENKLFDIVKRSAKIPEYTIREKVAQIIHCSNKFSSLKNSLLDDENYYVRLVFKSSMHS